MDLAWEWDVGWPVVFWWYILGCVFVATKGWIVKEQRELQESNIEMEYPHCQ